MDKERVLELINTLEIIDYNADGEILYYALVESSKENIEKLKQVGLTEKQIEESMNDGKDSIDLTSFVWNYAEWFDGEKFLTYVPDEIY